MRALAPASLVVLALVSLGCPSRERKEPRPVAAPRVISAVRSQAGSPLAGGVGHGDPGAPGDALAVTVELLALPELPELLDPLGTRTRLAASPLEESPLLGSTHLFAGARGGEVPDGAVLARVQEAVHARATSFARLRGALPRGVTAIFEAVRDGSCEVGGESFHERFAFSAFRRQLDGKNEDEALEIALELEDVHEAACGTKEKPATTRSPRREVLLLDALPKAPLPRWFAAFVPSPFDGDEPKAILALARIDRAPAHGDPGESAHALAFAACAGDLAREQAYARSCPHGAEHASHDEPPAVTEVDLAALLEPRTMRRALLLLGRKTGARLAQELALSGDEAVVASLSLAVSRQGAGAPPDALGWIAEREAFLTVRELRSRGHDDPRLEALISRRAGGAGRSGASLAQVIERATSLQDLERQLEAENRVLLEDGSPAVRARAFDWLSERGSAPPGYSPLDPVEARRAALERADRADRADRAQAPPPDGGSGTEKEGAR